MRRSLGLAFALLGIGFWHVALSALHAFSILIKSDVDWTYDCWFVATLAVTAIGSWLNQLQKVVNYGNFKFQFPLPVTGKRLLFFFSSSSFSACFFPPFCVCPQVLTEIYGKCRVQNAVQVPIEEQSMPSSNCRRVCACVCTCLHKDKHNKTRHKTSIK